MIGAIEKLRLRRMLLLLRLLRYHAPLTSMTSAISIATGGKRLELLAGKGWMASELGSKLSWMPMVGM